MHRATQPTHSPLPLPRLADTAILSWVADEEVYLLAGPVQDRSRGKIAVDLTEAVPIGQTVRLDFTLGQAYWAIVRLCTPSRDSYTVHAELQRTA